MLVSVMLKGASRLLRSWATESRLGNFRSCFSFEISQRHLVKGDALPVVDPNRMRLYSMLYCPYVHRTKLVLEHKKIPHEVVYVNLKSKPDWLFERNPFGLVPILEHKGNVVYESAVCNEFLEEAFPGSNTGTRDLLPSCLYRRAAARLMMFKIDKIFSSILGIGKQENADKCLEYLNSCQSRLEELELHFMATNEPFFGGSAYGMADLHLYPIFERFPALSRLGIDILPADRFPRLSAWMSVMQQQDCVRKCWISPNLYYHFVIGHRAGRPNYDVAMDEETLVMQNSVT